MRRNPASTALIVRDHEEVIVFYAGKLGFEVREDARLSSDKRRVVVAPSGGTVAVFEDLYGNLRDLIEPVPRP